MSKKTVTNYWFTIEPYTYVSIKNNFALLYNTLDGIIIESDNKEVIKLLQEILLKENCGVVLLTNERYSKKAINIFIHELREKFMGDVIDVTLSKGRPIQLLPFVNFYDDHEIIRKQNMTSYKNVLANLYEINIHVNHVTNVLKLIQFIQSLPENLPINLIGNIGEVVNINLLLSILNKRPSQKNILCSYENILSLDWTCENKFLYKISIYFPLDIEQWNKLIILLNNKMIEVEYVFDVKSIDDCQKAKQLIKQFKIKKYQMNPIYTGGNIGFFEENVFLNKDDVLSTPISLKDIFTNQAMNIYDFGKINILPNGDAYANVNYPALGNIYLNSIHEIVSKEMEDGNSWFRIRNQVPCNNCIYQWLCPPPSNLEIVIGRANLCHIK